MFILFKRNYRWIFCFFVLGILSFVWFQRTEGNIHSLMLIGPPIFAADVIKQFLFISLGLSAFFQDTPVNTVNDFFFLMPITIIYFTLVGFLLSQLQKEHGLLRFASILVLFVFLGFIHYKAWLDLTSYLVQTP